MNRLFEIYADLAARADASFQKMTADHGYLIRCKPGCSDCCHAVFGLFPIEAATVRIHFEEIPRKVRREALQRGKKADRELQRMEERWKGGGGDGSDDHRFLAGERVRCPLLDGDDACILYPHRPITCRVYGIPTAVRGRVRVCGKSGFAEIRSYPVFDLDAAYRELHGLSRSLLAAGGARSADKASLLISVPRTLEMPVADIIKGNF